MSELRSAEHEGIARQLANSGVDLNDQAATAMFLAATPMSIPISGWTGHIWERAKEIRSAREAAEPAWCSERLFEAEEFSGDILDPACGSGTIVRAAMRAGITAVGADLTLRSPGFLYGLDFLDPDYPLRAANIVSNPPLKTAEAFVQLALDRTAGKVAMLLPSNWVQGDKRSRWLATTPLKVVFFLAPRPSMPPGPVIAAGLKPGNGRTDYAWLVWERGYVGSPMIWWLHRDAKASPNPKVD